MKIIFVRTIRKQLDIHGLIIKYCIKILNKIDVIKDKYYKLLDASIQF